MLSRFRRRPSSVVARTLDATTTAAPTWDLGNAMSMEIRHRLADFQSLLGRDEDALGRIYLCGVHGYEGQQRGWIVRGSDDGGRTWTTLLNNKEADNSFAARIMVDTIGTVWVAGGTFPRGTLSLGEHRQTGIQFRHADETFRRKQGIRAEGGRPPVG